MAATAADRAVTEAAPAAAATAVAAATVVVAVVAVGAAADTAAANAVAAEASTAAAATAVRAARPDHAVALMAACAASRSPALQAHRARRSAVAAAQRRSKCLQSDATSNAGLNVRRQRRVITPTGTGHTMIPARAYRVGWWWSSHSCVRRSTGMGRALGFSACAPAKLGT